MLCYSAIFKLNPSDCVSIERNITCESEPAARRIALRMCSSLGMMLISIRRINDVTPIVHNVDDSALPSRISRRYSPFEFSAIRARGYRP
jgi:hypothetical protein